MAQTPTTPRPPKRRRRRSQPQQQPPSTRSNLGRAIGAAIGVTTAAGVMTGLYTPVGTTAPTCGGTERWNVKVANDSDASGGRINLTPANAPSIASLNAILPGPLDSGGRMAVEEKEYTVSGYLSFFKHEADGDYHVVITDQPGDFSKGTPNGRSMVVEFPDSHCFMGKSGQGPSSSALGQAIADARTTFEDKSGSLNGASIANPPRVTVTGVGFFDFDHGQTGRATPHPGVDGQAKVFELHPVTSIAFEGTQETD